MTDRGHCRHLKLFAITIAFNCLERTLFAPLVCDLYVRRGIDAGVFPSISRLCRWRAARPAFRCRLGVAERPIRAGAAGFRGVSGRTDDPHPLSAALARQDRFRHDAADDCSASAGRGGSAACAPSGSCCRKLAAGCARRDQAGRKACAGTEAAGPRASSQLQSAAAARAGLLGTAGVCLSGLVLDVRPVVGGIG